VCGLRTKALRAKSSQTVLGAPSTAEIVLANENNVRAIGRDATVTIVDFSIGPIKPSKLL
jgi:hypothetical protein